jgi:molybdopterin/thiamine biosynthesis adenylyltransferase
MSKQLCEQERERYSRQMMLRNFTEEHQQRLKNSHALVGGVGGLGGTAALYLAVAGIGKLTFVHSGKLELPDLNRQILMKHSGIGEVRIDQAKKSILDINPEVVINTFDERISDRNVRQLLATADIALSARPNFAERRCLNKACVDKGIPMIEAAMNGMEGYLFNVIPKVTSCLHCVFPQDDPDWEELGFSVLGAVPGMLGCMMALEAIKLLTGYGRPLFSQMLVMNGQNLEFMKIKIPRNAHCEVCGE